jgi:hypothetical protein
MRTRNTAAFMVAAVVAALVIGAIGFFLFGRTSTGTVQADSGSTTEAVAAAAGARVLPTEPGLKVEPK